MLLTYATTFQRCVEVSTLPNPIIGVPEMPTDITRYMRAGDTPFIRTALPMVPSTPLVASDQSVVASYRDHADAESAVRRLFDGGLPMNKISIIGRNFETHEDVQGFYRPADAALEGAGQGAWFGGLFGLMLGAMGFFVLPVIGGLLIMGPLAGLVAGAIGGAGVGALVNGLVASGVPRDQAILYQERLQAGEFIVVVHGNPDEIARAHDILRDTAQMHLQAHSLAESSAAESEGR